MSSPRIRSNGVSGQRQRGLMLVEVVVSIFLFGIVGTVVLSGISTNSRTAQNLSEQAVLENLARNQLEYVLSQPYQVPTDPPESCSLDPSLEIPADYSVLCEVSEYEAGNPNIATLKVTVTHTAGANVSLETVRAS